jgi:hypothetical protein
MEINIQLEIVEFTAIVAIDITVVATVHIGNRVQ